MNRMRTPLIAAACLAGLGSASGAFAADDAVVGQWRNARNTMHIEVRHCGPSVCGKVVWANAEAIRDAARGGTPNLIGTDIFRDFRLDAQGVWRGRVFVPDMNSTFSGTITLPDRNTLKGTGCLLGRFLCKSKVLIRLQ
jgi:uncharacterized protein (DUF2147 family)